MTVSESPNQEAIPSDQKTDNEMQILWEMSKLLNVNLSKEVFSLCHGLIDQGVSPEALAAIVKQLQSNSASPSNQN